MKSAGARKSCPTIESALMPRPLIVRVSLLTHHTRGLSANQSYLQSPRKCLTNREARADGVMVSIDGVAALRGVRARTLSPTGAVVAGGGALLFAGLGIAALGTAEQPAVQPA